MSSPVDLSLAHKEQQEIQRKYYAETASTYDTTHFRGGVDEHQFALAWMRGLIDLFDIRSVLDIGSGTGRSLSVLRAALPHVRFVGVEPSDALREQGYAKGLGRDDLVAGDAHRLTYADGEFDLVCEFGALHHIPEARRAVAEMLRVARKAIFISDANNFGQGSPIARAAKRAVRQIGLWPAVNWIQTRGKGYKLSEGDGLYYSYSPFDDYAQIRAACSSVHVMNTKRAGIDPFKTSAQVALLGLKEDVLTSA